jgi:hypothetical protein
MSDTAKRCPECDHELRMYDIADPTPIRRFLPGYLVGEITLWIVAGLLAVLGFIGWAIGAVIAGLVAWAIMRSSYRHVREKFARYHCAKCQNHFEGDALRKLTTDVQTPKAIRAHVRG